MKKDLEKEFAGLLVLLNPSTTKDGVNQPYEFGNVLSVSADQGLVRVSVPDGNIGNYKPQDLLTLQSKEVILKGLIADWDISKADCRIILQALKMLSKNDCEAAMKLAMTNDITRAFCLVRLSSCLDLIRTARKNPNHLKRK